MNDATAQQLAAAIQALATATAVPLAAVPPLPVPTHNSPMKVMSST